MSSQLESAFHAIPDPIAIVGAGGTIRRVNQTFCQRFEVPFEDAVGGDAATLIFGDGSAKQAGAGCFSPPPAESYVEERRDLTTAGVFEVLCHPVDLGSERGTICILRDVTERDVAEAEREALLRQLEDKNAELERYTYTVSHDLKSPLVTIKGFLGLVEKDALAGDLDRLHTDIARVGRAADRMAQLLDELLELSRIGRMTNPPEEVALRELIQEALENVGHAIEVGGVEIRLVAEPLSAHGDRLRLLEVLQNLLENAIRFMGDQAEPRIEIGAQRVGDEAVCFVRDNGIGIDPLYHDKIFGLFEQLDQNRGGTGIGLTLVKRIIEVHGGRVWIESSVSEEGSCFYFSLPAST